MKVHLRLGACATALAMMFGFPVTLAAQQAERQETTPRRADEGGGPYDRLVLKNVTVIDGTGAPPMSGANIVVEGDRIASIGRGQVEDEDGNTRVIDGTGMYVMPGFIDPHTHAGEDLLDESRKANINYLTQGVTTVFVGNDGRGLRDLEQKLAILKRQGIGSNVDRKSTRLNSSHTDISRMPSSA